MKTLFPSLKALVAAAVMVMQCHAAITWTPHVCGGKSFAGVDADQMWDNARLMARRAIEKINEAKTADSINPLSSESCAANNCKWLWGTKPDLRHRINDEDKQKLDGVTENLSRVFNLLSTNAGHFFCDDDVFQWGPIDVYATGAWQYRLPDAPGSVIIVQKYAGATNPPRLCAVDSSGITLGQTLRGYMPVLNAQGEVIDRVDVNVIVFCMRNHLARLKGVLGLNYKPSDGLFPDPDKYSSGAGTILHEMFHLLGLDFADKESEYFSGPAYGYARVVKLAEKDQEDAFKNPDNYRVFAEMSMADPSTRWAATKPLP
ncbi:hypothetical protein C8A03DRAFT_31755, partial [Achaetomium macrosporum]